MIETYTVIGCARCGLDHVVVFYPMTNPIVTDSMTFTWYGWCPNLLQPILMAENVNNTTGSST